MTLLWFLLALVVLVTFHEFGHFYIARLCGVKVLRFSVGFGKPLASVYDKHGTAYTLAPIPLGGYVKMLDEREGNVKAEELPQAFTQKTVWQRMAIVSAGPIANFILAIVLYFILAMIGIRGITPVIGDIEPGSLAAQAQLQAGDEIVSIGGKATPTWSAVFEQLSGYIGNTGQIDIEVREFIEGRTALDLSSTPLQIQSVNIEGWLSEQDRPNLLAELGIEPARPQTDWVLETVIEGGAAEASGLQVGDKLLAYDGQTVGDWPEWVEYVQGRADQSIAVEFERNGQQQSVMLTPRAVVEEGKTIGKVGMGSSMIWPESMVNEVEYSFTEAVVYGFSKTGEQIVNILSFLKKLITLDISTKNLGGAFTIAEVAGGTAAISLVAYLGFLAVFSVSLGVFNLLPIPVLDGGHLLFYSIEAIRGKPVAEKWQVIAFQVGLALVISLMVLAHYNDIVRLLS